MKSSKLLGPAAAAAAVYVIADRFRVPSDADDPVIYPQRRAARVLTMSNHHSLDDHQLQMIDSKTCNVGMVLYHVVTRNKYPSKGWFDIEPDTDLKMPTNPKLCDEVQKDTNRSQLGSGSFGYVKAHPTANALVYKKELEREKNELETEAVAMTLVNELEVTPKLIAWCPEQNAIISERMTDSLLEENDNWSTWSLAAQLHLVHAPMRSKLMVGGKISPEAVIAVYLDLLKALQGMHGKKIVHRDVHNGNVMYNPRKKCWVLIDLGLSGKATPTYQSYDLMSLAKVMLSLSNLIDLDWQDLVITNGPDRVRWIDAHPTVRFRAANHKGPKWNQIYAVMRASMTLKPRYADINNLIDLLTTKKSKSRRSRWRTK